MTKMTIIVQSMGFPFGWVKLSSAYLFRASSVRQAFSEHGSSSSPIKKYKKATILLDIFVLIMWVSELPNSPKFNSLFENI